MSISSLISPSGEPSVQDSLWHIALSTNSGQTDFKYVYDIYSGGDQLVRVKVYPDPTNGRGYFDAGSVVRNEIIYDWFVPVNNTNYAFLNTPNDSGQIAVTYNVRVGEDYSGVTTLNLASGNVTAYNWAPPLFNRKDGTDSTSMNDKWFSNRPKVIKAGVDDRILIPYKSTYDTDLYLHTKVNGNASYIYTASLQGCRFYKQFSIGIKVLNEYYSGDLQNDFGNDYSGIEYYDISVWDDTLGVLGESIRVYKDCNPKYQPINLFFMNAWGMFDTARFSLASRLTVDIERKSFSKNDYRLTNTSITYFDSNNTYNETKINYGSKSNWTYKLTMDFPTDEEYEWLYELMVSPQIYAELDGAFYPVTLKATNYEYSKYTNNKLRALELEIELNQTRYGFTR